MADRIRPVVLATLANLSKDGGNYQTFSIDEIAKRAVQLFPSSDYNELRQMFEPYLALAVSSGRDNHISGDPHHGFYFLTDAGHDFQSSIVAAVSGVAGASSSMGKRARDQQSSSSQPSDKRCRYSGGNTVIGAAAGTSGKGATAKKPATHSRQQPTEKSHGGHAGMPVEQYNLSTGRAIACFESYNEAERATGIGHSGIGECVKGKRTHAGNFGWRKAGSGRAAGAAGSENGATFNGQPTNKKLGTGGNPPKPVEQFDLATGRTIATFDSQADAARATGVDQSSISDCARGKYANAGGFGWRNIGPGAVGLTNGSHQSRPALSKPPIGTYSRLHVIVLMLNLLLSSISITNFTISIVLTSMLQAPAASSLKSIQNRGKTPHATSAKDTASRNSQKGSSLSSSSSLTQDQRVGEKRKTIGGAGVGKTGVKPTTSSSGIGGIPRRFQQPDPYNISLAKGTANFTPTLYLSILHPHTRSITRLPAPVIVSNAPVPSDNDSSDDDDDVDDIAHGMKPSTPRGQPAAIHHARSPKPVEQYDIATGRLIARYDSQNAGERATGILSAGISQCVRGEQKSAGGYGWRKPSTAPAAAAVRGKGTASKKPSTSSTPFRAPQPVEQYDRDTGRTIASFDSHNDAERATGIDQSGISKCVRGDVKHAGGYGFRDPKAGGQKGPSTSDKNHRDGNGGSGAGSARSAAIGQKVEKPSASSLSSSTSSSSSSSSSSSRLQSFGSSGGRGGLRKPVEQYNLATGRTIARFNSYSEGERATGVDHGTISACVRGKLSHGGRFGWRTPGSIGDATTIGKSVGMPSLSSSGNRMKNIGSNDGHYQASLEAEEGGEDVGSDGIGGDDGMQDEDSEDGGNEGQHGEVDDDQEEEEEDGAYENDDMDEEEEQVQEQEEDQEDEEEDDGASRSLSPVAWSKLPHASEGLIAEAGDDDIANIRATAAVSVSHTPAQVNDEDPSKARIVLASFTASLRDGGASVVVPSGSHAVSTEPISSAVAASVEDDDDDMGSVGTEWDPEGAEGTMARSIAATALPPTPITSTLRPIPILSPPRSSSSASTTASSSSSSSPASPVQMITEQQRQDMRDAVFDILMNRIHRSLSTGEKTARIVAFYDQATAIENVFFHYPTDDYLELFDRARLLEAFSYPPIKALYAL